MNQPSIIGQIAATMSANVAMQFDARLRECVEKRTGPLTDMSVLRGRLNAVKVKGSDKTTYYLDGEAIAQAGEIEVKISDGFARVERFFRELP